MDYDWLVTLRRQHPGWRLLAADHGPLVAAFLHRCFIESNQRTLAEAELAAQLDDYLYALRRQLGESAYPKSGRAYLGDWAGDERGWLRKYYPPGDDEPHYDLAPATEKAIRWLDSLQGQRFIGAESRLLTMFDLLHDMAEGAEADPRLRIDELNRRKQAIEQEIESIEAGHVRLMDATGLRERFLQISDLAHGLLADFRQVEQNFRILDRQVREKVAAWEGGKGDMLEDVFGEHDSIADSDQGRSFRAFWDFLMSPARQEELSGLLEKVLTLDAVRELKPDPRFKRVHYDWLDAGEVTLRTVARLSEQLRRYLDDQAWLENRRIMQLIHMLEQHALALRDTTEDISGMMLDETAPVLNLPMERPLFRPPVKPHIDEGPLASGDADLDAAALFDQFHVDRAALAAVLRRSLQTRDQITLARLLESHPLERGLAELVTWLALAADDPHAVIDETRHATLDWCDRQGVQRRATVPEVIFTRHAHE